jgi:hypothetical protein
MGDKFRFKGREEGTGREGENEENIMIRGVVNFM